MSKIAPGKSIAELTTLLQSKQVSASEITQAYFEQINQFEKDINAFITPMADQAMAQARQIDADIAAGKTTGALAGVPVAVKDNICVQGVKTSCGSKILGDFSSQYEATAIQNLRATGAVIVGKTNLDEFAMGSSTEHSAFKRTKNPFDLDCVPGGSSGGSAAAVAAGFAVTALGSDTGGSIRQPAAFCGVVGMKPTYGMVSRFGLVAFASSLDQIGPFARNVEDCAMTLAAVSGHDPKDSTSLPNPYRDNNPKNYPQLTFDFVRNLAKESPEEHLKGLRIGVIKELVGEGIETDVRDSILEAAKLLTRLGATVDEISLPHSKYALPVYYILATAEASANLSRFDGVRYGLRDKEAGDILSMYQNTRHEGFGSEVKRRIMLGTYALSSGYYDAYYKKAQQVRRLITQDFTGVFANYDLVLSPTAPSCAFKIGEKTDDPLQMYLGDIATIPANLAGLPGISLPSGLGTAKMPVGLQLLGSPVSDSLVVKAAYALEKALNLDLRPPYLKEPACKN
ncbi:MAG: Asp-tRNA(Asn)/Glu-tRNA(Gln) amidotransferase subunit GatA [Cyanobacteria bacterium SZAS LIN-2]|nr:Asp-tRNA(Asn)/Glu-tRNA(Gln) amidotransferase subunit GatA [Cyanobacteria bacterium SZAS LIN-2]